MATLIVDEEHADLLVEALEGLLLQRALDSAAATAGTVRASVAQKNLNAANKLMADVVGQLTGRATA